MTVKWSESWIPVPHRNNYYGFGSMGWTGRAREWRGRGIEERDQQESYCGAKDDREVQKVKVVE